MSAILLTGPAIEPVSLAEAKSHLRVAHSDEDAAVAAFVTAARMHIEARTRRALITQTWRLVRDVWPADGRIAVLPAPLRELLAARIVMRDGSAQNIELDRFTLDRAAAPAIVAFDAALVPRSDRPVAGIELDVEAGYGDAPEDVPRPLRQAMLLLIAHWHENRSAVTDRAALLPLAVEALIAPYRVLSL